MGRAGAVCAVKHGGDECGDAQRIGGAEVDAANRGGNAGDARDVADDVELQLPDQPGVRAGVFGGSIAGVGVVVGVDFAVPNDGIGRGHLWRRAGVGDGGGDLLGPLDAGSTRIYHLDFWASDLVFAGRWRHVENRSIQTRVVDASMLRGKRKVAPG